MVSRISFATVASLMPLAFFFLFMNVPSLFFAPDCGKECVWRMPLIGWLVIGPIVFGIAFAGYEPNSWRRLVSRPREHAINGLIFGLGSMLFVGWLGLFLFLVSTAQASNFPQIWLGIACGTGASFFVAGWFLYDMGYIVGLGDDRPTRQDRRT